MITYKSHRSFSAALVVEYMADCKEKSLILNAPETLDYLKKTGLIVGYHLGKSFDDSTVSVRINSFGHPNMYAVIMLSEYLQYGFGKAEAERVATWHESLLWVCSLENKYLAAEI